MTKKFTRRQLLKLLALAAGGSLTVLIKKSIDTHAQINGEQEYLPITINSGSNVTPTLTLTPLSETPAGTPTNTPIGMPSPTHTGTPTQTPTPTATGTATTPTTQPPPPASNTVIHVYSPNASSWNGSPSDYWNYVDQAVIDNMVDQGMMQLTGTSTVADAWNAVMANYQAGQNIAIKASFNNISSCDQTSGQIDSIIEPINAVIRGLKLIGVAESNIWIFDAIRPVPTRFINGCDYGEVIFYGSGSCNTAPTFTSDDPNAFVYYNVPPPSPTCDYVIAPQRISDVVINADYLINIPIMKIHGMSGVSLAFKNHYGSTQNPDDLHNYSAFASPCYTPNYSPLIDLYNNPHIVGKTILTISDSIFCAMGNTRAPALWESFGNQTPKSLLFSLDPVAIDSVMCDLLNEEIVQQGHDGLNEKSDDYLVLAENAGLGTFERGDPWALPYGSGYELIDYRRIEV